MNFVVKCICNIACAFSIVYFGRAAVETSNLLICILCWFAVYFVLELHVRLINYIERELL